MISSRDYRKFREALLEEFDNKCSYCGSKLGVTDIGQVEHFYPKSKYPEKELDMDNLLIACNICNISKGSHFPVDREDNPLLFNPRVDSFDEHFQLKSEGELVGLTEKGQITIELLRLNRDALVEQRRYELIEKQYYKDREGDEVDAFTVFNESLEKIRELNAVDVTGKNNVDQYLNNLLYANVITALETFLADVFINKVVSDKKYLRSFVESFHNFQKEKFELREIFEKYESIEEKTLKSLRDVIFHDLPKVKGMYCDTFNMEFPDIEAVYKGVFIRHDLVHRNGRSKDGNIHTISSKDVADFCDLIERFVSELITKLDGI